MLSSEYVAGLEPCESGCTEGTDRCDARDAMVWLADSATSYGASVQTQPLEPLTKIDKPKRFCTFTVKMRRSKYTHSAMRIGRIYSYDGTESSDSGELWTSEILAEYVSTHLVSRKNAGSLLVTSGRSRCILDQFLEELGPHLLDLGYSIQPCISGSKIGFITIRKDHRTWTIAYAETISGTAVDTLRSYARDVNGSAGLFASTVKPRELHTALGAYQAWLLESFGVAINPTVGMTALRCVRRYLPEGFHKWRPTPLLVAMERLAKGYRGGLTYAVRYRGPSWRIDVTRQYTAALGAELPYRTAFGRFISEEETPGVFMCHVRMRGHVPYPLGVWDGYGFSPKVCGPGHYVSVLHTSEFAGIEAMGGEIAPYYGYIYTHTFALTSYLECLQSILDKHGAQSAIGQLIKPLGNYVYGKFGQSPVRLELLFSKDRPDDKWFPYMDDELRVWPQIWERKVTRVTSSQHVDIAGAITAIARSQTLSTWALLLDAGIQTVRCHTDSLTVTKDPSQHLALDTGRIGDWHLESEDADSVIVGANAYIDQDGAHIAGVTDPTWEMIERLYDSQVVYVVQQQNAPMRGFARGQQSVRKRYGG